MIGVQNTSKTSNYCQVLESRFINVFGCLQRDLPSVCIFCYNHEKINCLAWHARVLHMNCAEVEIVCAYECEYVCVCVQEKKFKYPLASECMGLWMSGISGSKQLYRILGTIFLFNTRRGVGWIYVIVLLYMSM